jgi:hypothetical protein
MGGPREIGALSNFPAYMAVFLYTLIMTQEKVLAEIKAAAEAKEI